MTLEQILIRIECLSAHDEDLAMLCNQLRAGNMQGRKQVAAMALRLCGDLTMHERRELWRWGRVDGLAKVPEVRALVR